MSRLFALILLLTICPLFVIIFLIITLLDGFPTFFIQERLGKNKTVFKVIKFRTMKNEKITKAGKILRKTGFDETPQLINILKGEMVFIGPRPLTKYDVDRLEWNSNYYSNRWNVKPGLTGLAQLSPKCHKKMSFFLDQYYANNKSFLLNLKIISVTFLALFIGKSRAKNIYFNR